MNQQEETAIKPRYHLIQKIATLLLALFVPASALSFLFLYQASRKLETQTLTAIHDSNVSFVDSLDENLQLLYHMDYQLMNNYDWIQFGERMGSMEAYERFTIINSLRDQLTLVKAIHPLLESVHIYFPEIATIYHSSPYAYGSFTVLDEEQDRFYQELAAREEHMLYYTEPVSGNQALSLIMIPPNSAIDYYIILTLSTDSISQNIAGNSFYDGDFYYFTIDAESSRIDTSALTANSAMEGNSDIVSPFSLSNLEPAMEDEAALFLRRMHTENHQQNDAIPWQKIRIDGQNYYAFYYALSYSDAYYIRLLPVSFL